ncbi:MAG: UMP kinase [Chloroflexi bacterium]|nr:UMP kinase [Chloroflexota bacterium]
MHPVADPPVYRRAMLKLSGTALADESGFGVDPERVAALARQVVAARNVGVEVGVVVGAGNIWRGESAQARGMHRSTADYMGMLGTAINALALQQAIEALGVETRVMTAIEMREVAEPYIRRRAVRHLERGRIVIFGAGTGNPYFTTDTAGALRASGMDADILLKATRVNGVFDRDPEKHPDAVHFPTITYIEALNRRLQVMDATAFSLCMQNNMPIVVFELDEKAKNLVGVLRGESIGTRVEPG